MRMLMIAGAVGCGLLVAGLIVFSVTTQVVHETEQGILLRFGEVREVRTQPGLYSKSPWDSTVTYSKRLLPVDADIHPMPDRDLNFLEIDVYAHYRITDPVRFFATLGHEANARDRLAQIINASLRDEVARRTQEEIIGGRPERDERGRMVIDQEGNARLIATESRTELLERVLESTRQRLAREDGESFGIELHDVRIKRVDFPGELGAVVFARMVSEREERARRLRAQGEAEPGRILAVAGEERDVILAEGKAQADEVAWHTEDLVLEVFVRAVEQESDLAQYREPLLSYQQSRGTGSPRQ